MIVHLLQYGQTLCLMPGVPKDWPEDHRWVGVDEGIEHVNCEECKKVILKNRTFNKDGYGGFGEDKLVLG